MSKQYKLEDILIVGDSFCHDRYSSTDWPNIVTQHLTGDTGTPRGFGFPGCSWWSTRSKLIEELNIGGDIDWMGINVPKKSTPKIVILAHTETMRIPSDDNYALNFNTAESGEMHFGPNGERTGQLDREVHQAALLYYKRLISEKFHEWTNLQWFKELDEMLDNPQIEKVIHLFSFGWEYSKHTFNIGVTVDEDLYQYCGTEQGLKNHMTDDENVRFGKSILNVIENYTGNGTRCYNKLL
jgi:hypothetical protein